MTREKDCASVFDMHQESAVLGVNVSDYDSD